MASIRWFLLEVGFAAVIALTFSEPTMAQERVALVIGNGKYAHAIALPNPANDARAVAKALGDIGFTVTQGVDLDRTGMERQLRDFLRKAGSARVALLFYAGHGMQVDGKNYLVPVDAKLEAASDLSFETIELDKLLDNLNDATRANIVILDACRDNPLARSFAARLGPTRSGAVSTGLAAYSALGTGTLIAFATAPGQVAIDGDRANSPFTEALVKHLATPNLEVRQMLTRVRADVAASTRNRQIPWDNSSLLGEVFLASRGTAVGPLPGTAANPPQAVDPDATARAAFVAARQTGTRAAYDAFLRNYSSGLFAELARQERDRLAALETRPAPAAPPPIVTTPSAPSTPPPSQSRIDAGSAPEVSWKLQNTFARYQQTTLPLLVRRVSELSGGRMKIEVLDAGAVVPSFQVIDAVKNNMLDIGYIQGSMAYGKDRAFTLMMAVPFGFTPRDQVAFRRRPDVSAIFNRLLAQHGVFGMPCGAFGRNGEFWLKKPLTDTTTALAGVTMRVVGLSTEIYQQAGGAAAVLPGGEIVSALERGLIDGAQFIDPKNDLELRLPDVAKHYYYPGSMLPGYVMDLVVAKNRWDALPPAAHQIVEQACREALDAMLNEYERLNRDALAEISRKGVTVAAPPEAVTRKLYAGARAAMTKLSAENQTARELMAIVEKMRANTVAARL